MKILAALVLVSLSSTLAADNSSVIYNMDASELKAYYSNTPARDLATDFIEMDASELNAYYSDVPELAKCDTK